MTTLGPVITDCLGRQRIPQRVYEDGSWNCPFCCAAVQVGSEEHTARKCPNPACFARGPSYPFPPDMARDILAKQEESKRRTEAWQRTEEWRRQYADESRRAENERLANVATEAKSRGACQDCAIESARYGRTPKFVKHRKTCPKAK